MGSEMCIRDRSRTTDGQRYGSLEDFKFRRRGLGRHPLPGVRGERGESYELRATGALGRLIGRRRSCDAGCGGSSHHTEGVGEGSHGIASHRSVRILGLE